MNLKPEIEADITVLPAEANPRKGPLRDDIVGYYGCPMELQTGRFDCRMFFPDAQGKVDSGQTARAMIQFSNPVMVLPGLRVGDRFKLWENGVIATGIVKKIMGSTLLGTNLLKCESHFSVKKGMGHDSRFL